LPTQVEGECQIYVARTMYEQIQPISTAEADANRFLGDRHGTAQWVQHRQKPFTFNNASLCDIGTKIIDRYHNDPIQFRNLCGVFFLSMRPWLLEGKGVVHVANVELIQASGECLPTIALKSGPEAEALRALTSHPVKVKIIPRMDQSQEELKAFELEVPADCSTSKLCRMATSHVREYTEYKQVQFVFCSPDLVPTRRLKGGETIHVSTLDPPRSGANIGVNCLEDLPRMPPQWENRGDLPLQCSLLPLAWSADKWLLAHDIKVPEESKDRVAAFCGTWGFLQVSQRPASHSHFTTVSLTAHLKLLFRSAFGVLTSMNGEKFAQKFTLASV